MTTPGAPTPDPQPESGTVGWLRWQYHGPDNNPVGKAIGLGIVSVIDRVCKYLFFWTAVALLAFLASLVILAPFMRVQYYLLSVICAGFAMFKVAEVFQRSKEHHFRQRQRFFLRAVFGLLSTLLVFAQTLCGF